MECNKYKSSILSSSSSEENSPIHEAQFEEISNNFREENGTSPLQYEKFEANISGSSHHFSITEEYSCEVETVNMVEEYLDEQQPKCTSPLPPVYDEPLRHDVMNFDWPVEALNISETSTESLTENSSNLLQSNPDICNTNNVGNNNNPEYWSKPTEENIEGKDSKSSYELDESNNVATQPKEASHYVCTSDGEMTKRDHKRHNVEEILPSYSYKGREEEKPGKKKNKRSRKDINSNYELAPPKKLKKERKHHNAYTQQEQEEEKAEDVEEVEKKNSQHNYEDAIKWVSLEHKGPLFPPPYERLPHYVRFFYAGKVMHLSLDAEEAATFYAKILNSNLCKKDLFTRNFFADFRSTMTQEERQIITDINQCDFSEMHKYFITKAEKLKRAKKLERFNSKNDPDDYGHCMINGHKEKIINFRLEPPGLFCCRGEHPNMGMIKRRIQASDVSINCGEDSKIPKPPHGQHWKRIRHDNTLFWLATWIDKVEGQVRYITLSPNFKLKAEKHLVKFEMARCLRNSIEMIRTRYCEEWSSPDAQVRQRAVALYLIDVAGMKVGNERDEDFADIAGCSALEVQHLQHEPDSADENLLYIIVPSVANSRFSYHNTLKLEQKAFKNLSFFCTHKVAEDYVFDLLNPQILTDYMKELMNGLTAKVFRIHNTSTILQEQLDMLTEEDSALEDKLNAYDQAMREMKIICNYPRIVPIKHQKSIDKLKEKIHIKWEEVKKCDSQFQVLINLASISGQSRDRTTAERKGNKLEKLKEQLEKFRQQETEIAENIDIFNANVKYKFIDPRIIVAWCKKHEVPIDKIYDKDHLTKYSWAIEKADNYFRF